MRYLGLDVGDRWIGLASGDSDSRLSSPLRTVRRSGRRADLGMIRGLCMREGIETVVVGLPRNMDGSLGPQARRTRAFAEALREDGLPVVYCDERLSSVAAEEYVTATRGRRLRPGERIDHVAAAIILQDYLTQHYTAQCATGGPAIAAHGDAGRDDVLNGHEPAPGHAPGHAPAGL